MNTIDIYEGPIRYIYPWNIPQILNPPVYEGNPSIFLFWGTWRLFQGSVCIFLEFSYTIFHQKLNGILPTDPDQ